MSGDTDYRLERASHVKQCLLSLSSSLSLAGTCLLRLSIFLLSRSREAGLKQPLYSSDASREGERERQLTRARACESRDERASSSSRARRVRGRERCAKEKQEQEQEGGGDFPLSLSHQQARCMSVTVWVREIRRTREGSCAHVCTTHTTTHLGITASLAARPLFSLSLTHTKGRITRARTGE